jgi:fermentation-respiration switch protein FrsA (DUF1100 family)
LIGRSEGRSVLDAVRAARAYDHRLSRRYVIAGHSQGGHAALFAAAAAPTWVPELRLRGTVAFAPASHLKAQFQAAAGVSRAVGGLGAIIALGLRAIDSADPTLGVPSLLTPEAATLYPQTKTRCYDALSRADSFGGLPLNQFVKSGANLQPVFTVAGESDPEHLRMRTPVRIEQGTQDTTVFPTFTNQLADEYATNGVKVTYKTYDGVSHGAIVNAAAGDATKWIRARLK